MIADKEAIPATRFMQSPSLLDFQRTMLETQGKNNAQLLFGAFFYPGR